MSLVEPKLLLLPGLEGSGDLFAGLAEALGPAHKVEIVRYPASCRTYVDASSIVRQALSRLRPLLIVAESFSTPLAIQIAADAHSDVAGLVLCNGFVANPLSGIESMMASVSAPWLFRMPLNSVAVRTFLVGPDASDELVRAVQSAVAPVSPSVLCARLHAVMHCDAREASSRIQVPTLYLHAQRDRLIGEAGLKQILRIRPDVQVTRIDGPHLLLQKEPQRCAEVILQFLDRILKP